MLNAQAPAQGRQVVRPGGQGREAQVHPPNGKTLPEEQGRGHAAVHPAAQGHGHPLLWLTL